jgi:hypothetical protein
MNNNERTTVKATHTINKKTQVDIVTMNTALANVFLKALSLQVCTSFLQRRLCKPNIVFVDMFMWFVDHYGMTTAEDCKANHQRMAADWPLMVLTHSSFASSPAQRLQDAPTSRWPTAASLTLASA